MAASNTARRATSKQSLTELTQTRAKQEPSTEDSVAQRSERARKSYQRMDKYGRSGELPRLSGKDLARVLGAWRRRPATAVLMARGSPLHLATHATLRTRTALGPVSAPKKETRLRNGRTRARVAPQSRLPPAQGQQTRKQDQPPLYSKVDRTSLQSPSPPPRPRYSTAPGCHAFRVALLRRLLPLQLRRLKSSRYTPLLRHQLPRPLPPTDPLPRRALPPSANRARLTLEVLQEVGHRFPLVLQQQRLIGRAHV